MQIHQRLTVTLLVLIMNLAIAAVSTHVHASCSPYIGLGTINEVYNKTQSISGTQDHFVEVKALSESMLAPAGSPVIEGWTFSICSKIADNDGAGCIEDIPVSQDDIPNTWYVMDQNDIAWPYIDLAKTLQGNKPAGMEIVLRDADDNIVDYLSIAGYTNLSTATERACSFPYQTTFEGDNNDFNIQRLPDGTGEWGGSGGGESGEETTNTSNDPTLSGAPELTISNATALAGELMSFTVTLSSSSAYDVTFDYGTSDLSSTTSLTRALAGTDYTATSGSATIPAGQTSTTITVQTNSNATPDSHFLMNLLGVTSTVRISGTDYKTAIITSNTAFGTILSAPEVTSFRITPETSSASTCTPLKVTIEALDTNGDIVTDYGGTITISTSTVHGNWSVTPASGSNPDAPVNNLNPTPDNNDDGAVGYTFDSTANTGDGGAIVLYLSNTHADNNLVIRVTDASIPLTSSSSAISFSNNVFIITPTTSTAGVVNSTSMIAGRPHDFEIALWTRDSTTGLCSIASGYDASNQGLKVYIDRGTELTGAADPTLDDTDASDKTIDETLPGSDNVILDFSNTSGSGGTAAGIAGFTLNTTDVGKYTLHVSDDGNSFASGNTVTGSIDLTAIPFAFTLDYSGQRAADLGDDATLNDSTGTDTSYATDSSGTVFKTAGSDFSLAIGAALWESGDDTDNDGALDSGSNPYNNTLAPSFGSETSATNAIFSATVVSPTVGASTGTLTTTTPVSGGGSSSFSGGAATATLNWSEVGILDINLSMAGYLGSAISINGSMPYVGRFTPASYAVIINDGAFENTHTGGGSDFTYVGEAFDYSTDPTIDIYPLNIIQTTWAESTSYSAGDYVLSSDGNGRVYRVTSGGSSGGTEPTWPTTTGATVTINGVTYEDVGPLTDYVTLNYTANSGEYNKLTSSDLGITVAATDTTSGLATSGSAGTLSGPTYNANGSLRFTLSNSTISLAHTATPIAPFTPSIDLNLAAITDSDNIAYSDGTTFIPTGNSQRYGRLVLSDSYGSSSSGSTVPLPLFLQYYNGSTFIDNSDDVDSSFNSSLLVCSDPNADSLACGDISITSADIGHGESFLLTASGDRGTLTYTLDLTTAAPHLMFDWAGSGTLSNPGAGVTFGVFRGDDRFLYWREVERP